MHAKWSKTSFFNLKYGLQILRIQYYNSPAALSNCTPILPCICTCMVPFQPHEHRSSKQFRVDIDFCLIHPLVLWIYEVNIKFLVAKWVNKFFSHKKKKTNDVTNRPFWRLSKNWHSLPVNRNYTSVFLEIPMFFLFCTGLVGGGVNCSLRWCISNTIHMTWCENVRGFLLLYIVSQKRHTNSPRNRLKRYVTGLPRPDNFCINYLFLRL